MMTLAQIRTKYRAATPAETLDNLAAVFGAAPAPENYKPPLLTVTTRSGFSFKGYLLNRSQASDGSVAYLFCTEVVTSADGANDLCYVCARDVEVVTVWNVEDYKGILPR